MSRRLRLGVLLCFASANGAHAIFDPDIFEAAKQQLLSKTTTYQFELPSGQGTAPDAPSRPGSEPNDPPASQPPPRPSSSSARPSSDDTPVRPAPRMRSSGRPSNSGNSAEPVVPGRGPKHSTSNGDASALQDFMELLFWTVAAAGLGLTGLHLIVNYTKLPVWIMEVLPRLKKARRVTEPSADSAVVAAPSMRQSSLSEADELARTGHYKEALRVLLSVGLAAVADRTPSGLPDSMTSREVLGSGFLPETATAMFGSLSGSVEVCVFGGRVADETTFQASRAWCTLLLRDLEASA